MSTLPVMAAALGAETRLELAQLVLSLALTLAPAPALARFPFPQLRRLEDDALMAQGARLFAETYARILPAAIPRVLYVCEAYAKISTKYHRG